MKFKLIIILTILAIIGIVSSFLIPKNDISVISINETNDQLIIDDVEKNLINDYLYIRLYILKVNKENNILDDYIKYNNDIKTLINNYKDNLNKIKPLLDYDIKSELDYSINNDNKKLTNIFKLANTSYNNKYILSKLINILDNNINNISTILERVDNLFSNSELSDIDKINKYNEYLSEIVINNINIYDSSDILSGNYSLSNDSILAINNIDTLINVFGDSINIYIGNSSIILKKSEIDNNNSLGVFAYNSNVLNRNVYYLSNNISDILNKGNINILEINNSNIEISEIELDKISKNELNNILIGKKFNLDDKLNNINELDIKILDNYMNKYSNNINYDELIMEMKANKMVSNN